MLTEKVRLDIYDFEFNPVVYNSHPISVDRRLLHTMIAVPRLYHLVS
jgi:hypothetical protein